MQSTTFSRSATQLTRLGLVNCYLVHEEDSTSERGSFTLIDAGLPGSAPAILQAAAAAGAPIKRILLTHAHGDHVGSVDALVSAITTQLGTPPALAISARSLPLLQKTPNKSLEPGEPSSKIRGSLPGIKSVPTHTIAEGELFGSLRCIATPGHIPGHFSFLDERDGTLFAGDALVGVRILAVSGYAPWYFPLPNVATWDKPTAVASARKLLDYPIQCIACGHGRVQTGGIPQLRKVLDQLPQ